MKGAIQIKSEFTFSLNTKLKPHEIGQKGKKNVPDSASSPVLFFRLLSLVYTLVKGEDDEEDRAWVESSWAWHDDFAVQVFVFWECKEQLLQMYPLLRATWDFDELAPPLALDLWAELWTTVEKDKRRDYNAATLE